MGSRGAFVSVESGNFTFKTGGQNYHSLGILSTNPNVKIIAQEKGAVKAPEYSHTPGRIYAVVQKGSLKHVSYYDENHKQTVLVDLGHKHGGIMPHIHLNMNHDKNAPGIPPTAEQLALVKQIKKEFHLR